MSIEHGHKLVVWSPFQNPSSKTSYGAPKRRNHHDVISSLQENIIFSETMLDRGEVTIKHYQETIIALPNFVFENCTQRPLAEMY